VPDFGFSDELNTDINNVWTLLFDHITQHPKYERLKNYIDQMSKEKLEFIKKKVY
jgi:hypothetical protein